MAIMQSILTMVALIAVGANASTPPGFEASTLIRSRDIWTYTEYLNEMCTPLLHKFDGLTPQSEVLSAASNSPFPCEQLYYLHLVCFANGTTTNDFLAEQQCLCGGNYFDAAAGCHQCELARGVISTPSEIAGNASELSSLKTAECSATPVTAPYTNLFRTDVPYINTLLSSDRFPNDTAVANYWTGATAPILGKITGSAVNHQSSFTNERHHRFTPTAAVSTGGSVTTTSAPTSTGDAGADAGASAATSTGGAPEIRVAGGLLVAVVGVLAAL